MLSVWRSRSAGKYGLKLGSSVAARIADACANDQALAAQELESWRYTSTRRRKARRS